MTNGNDLVAAYSRATPEYFPRPLVEFICEQLDVGDRPQEYQKGEWLFSRRKFSAPLFAVPCCGRFADEGCFGDEDMTLEKYVGELLAARPDVAL